MVFAASARRVVAAPLADTRTTGVGEDGPPMAPRIDLEPVAGHGGPHLLRIRASPGTAPGPAPRAGLASDVGGPAHVLVRGVRTDADERHRDRRRNPVLRIAQFPRPGVTRCARSGVWGPRVWGQRRQVDVDDAVEEPSGRASLRHRPAGRRPFAMPGGPDRHARWRADRWPSCRRRGTGGGGARLPRPYCRSSPSRSH